MDLIPLSLIIAFAVLFILLFLGIPISWSMLLGGLVGFAVLGMLDRGMNLAVVTAWGIVTREALICIPLYLMMGSLLFLSGMAGKLFDFAMAIFSRLKLKGGLAMAVVFANAVFGAVSGSIAAAISTFGPVIISEAEKNRYNKNFLASVLAMSGSLAALIPPSLNLILFGIITEESIAALFIAGLIPGVILVIIYCAIIYIMVARNPVLGPTVIKPMSWRQVGGLGLSNLPVVIVIVVVLGGIYLGLFTPTESSAAGVIAVLILALLGKKINARQIFTSILNSAKLLGMIVTLLIGAFTLVGYVSLSQTIVVVSDFIAGLALGPYAFLAIIWILYFVIGCAIGATGIMVLTLPILFPIVVALDIDPIMFGIFTNLAVAVAEVTPPVALNIYTTQGVINNPDVNTGGMIRLIWPYIIGASFVIVLIVIFPQICTWLPSTMR